MGEKWKGKVAKIFSVDSNVTQGCVHAPSLLNTCLGWVLGTVANKSRCWESADYIRSKTLFFSDDAVLPAKSLEVLIMAFEVLHKEAKPLGSKPKLSRLETLDDTVQSTHGCNEETEVTKSFTYLCSVVQNDGEYCPAQSHDGLAWPTWLWTLSTRVYSVVEIYAHRGRFESLSHSCFLFYCMAVRHEY